MFRPHHGTCLHPDCKSPEGALLVVKKGWCQRCNHNEKQAKKGSKAKKNYHLPRVSDKRAKEERIYSVARELFLTHHPNCGVVIPGICTGRATDVHHTYSGKDRARFYLDQTTWFAVDRPCHDWIHKNPADARKLGYLK
jgi:hypothetical protein